MLKILLSAAGFLLLILLCSEEFRDSLQRQWRRLTALPRGKYLAYPLAAALALAAAGLILFALWSFLSTTFSYD
jgi:hypothetical protein